MGFARSVKGWAQNKRAAADDCFRGACVDAAHALVEKTPVKTGQARGGWRGGINRTPSTPADGKRDTHGEFTKAHIEASLVGAKVGDRVVIANAVPHIHFLENGTVKMAARAMVASTRAEWPLIVEARRRRHKV